MITSFHTWKAWVKLLTTFVIIMKTEDFLMIGDFND